VLLCDEPTGALDSQTGVLVLDAIQRVNRDLGATTALITHNQVIADMANRVIAMADGRIVEVRTNTRRLAPAELAW
ncbi:MAG: ABC transporter ATP-binding protein, partial [Alphaproteobacteria bacterium]